MDRAVEYSAPRCRKAEKRAGRAVKEGMIANYIHTTGKIAVLVSSTARRTSSHAGDFQQLGRWIAEHVAPRAVGRRQDAVPAEKVESERTHLLEQVKAEGSPSHDRQDRRGKIKAFYKDGRADAPGVVREPKKTIAIS